MGRVSLVALVVVAAVASVGCSTASEDPAATSDCAADGTGCVTTGAPSCADGRRDGDEVGIDCGGSCPTKCDGAPCGGASECKSADCTRGVCGPSPGKTCGVALPSPCNDGEACGVDADCASDYCGADAKCAPPSPDAHHDGRRDAGETGVDCGGPVATTQPCSAGQGCTKGDDCASRSCKSGACAAPACDDGVKNGDETDVDCGGPTCATRCLHDRACVTNADCQLDACTAQKCVIPTSTDAVKNGGETDVDCGGAGVTEGAIAYRAPRCLVDKKCTADSDCTSGGCAAGTGTCAVLSCATAETAGIVTCGKGETGDAAASHESCCRSLVLPSRTTRRLDKYEITAGRFRTFLAKAGPNVRQFVARYVAANPGSQLAQLVGLNGVVAALFPAADRFDALSLTAHMSHDIDNYNGIRGCANYAGSYSANTYWMDAVHYADFGIPPRSLPRSVSDEKSLNCAMPIMFAAFCAWDGGELATFADYWDAWPNTQRFAANVVTDNTFPWPAGNLCGGSGGQGPGGSLPCAHYNWCNGTLNNGGFTCQNTALAVNGEQGVFYEFPIATDRSLDNEPLIAAPGRFQLDASQLTSGGEHWYDLWGNMAEITGDFAASSSDFCDFSAAPAAGATTCTRALRAAGDVGTRYTDIPVAGLIGNTWEGHQYGRGVQQAWPVTAQYGKFGARCVRPAAPY